VQYVDYAVWQRKQWDEGRMQEQVEYWKRLLSGVTPLQLPTDHERPKALDLRGSRVPVRLDRELTEALHVLSRQEGTTLFMTLLAGLGVLLSRYSGQEDMCIGTPVAGRTRPELEPLLGCFLNTLALRSDTGGNPEFRAYLRQVKELTLDAFSHQEIPFEKVVDEVKPERDTSHSPIFQVMFVLQNTPRKALHLPQVTLEPMVVPVATSQFELVLDLTETAEGLCGELRYQTSLFETDTIQRMSEHFEQVLRSALADPNQKLLDVKLLTAKEREQVLTTWNATETPFPTESCIHELFESQVSRLPESLAVVFEQESLTYAELNSRANRLAHHLRFLGVKPDCRVAICVGRSLEMVVGLLAVLKAGGAYVPLDPAYPVERLRHMLVDSEPVALLTQGDLAKGVVDGLVDGLPIIDLSQPFKEQAATNLNPDEVSLTSRHLAYVIYTSGSTGMPKG